MTPSSAHTPKILLLAAYVAWLAWLWVSASPSPGEIAPLPPGVETSLGLENALFTLRDDLQACMAGEGAFPDTHGEWRQVDMQLGAGQSGQSLAHALLDRTLPMSSQPGPQVIYRSDGRDYKLLAHGGTDCTLYKLRRPELVDPVRMAYTRSLKPGGWLVTSAAEAEVARRRAFSPQADPALPNPLSGECWAWGVWTPCAVFW